MNWLDILLLILLGLGFVKGLFDGLVKQVVSLIALAAAVLFCSEVATVLQGYVMAWDWFSEKETVVICYILAFVLILFMVNFIGNLVSHLVNATPLSVLNHIGGGLLGLLCVLFFSSLALNVVEYVDSESFLIPRNVKMESQFYALVVNIVPTIFPVTLFKW